MVIDRRLISFQYALQCVRRCLWLISSRVFDSSCLPNKHIKPKSMLTLYNHVVKHNNTQHLIGYTSSNAHKSSKTNVKLKKKRWNNRQTRTHHRYQLLRQLATAVMVMLNFHFRRRTFSNCSLHFERRHFHLNNNNWISWL